MPGSPQPEPRPQSIDALLERDWARLRKHTRRLQILLAVVALLLVARMALALVVAGWPGWRRAWPGVVVLLGLLALNWWFWRRRRDWGA